MRQNYDQPIKFQVNYATGEIDGFTQGTNTYWYRKNQQGDVTGIFNTAYGNTALFVEYEYDAWGNIISITGDGASTIGAINPIRYRGYFYDTETGYYYLNSRYYDPTTGRFLNGDVYADTGQGVLGSNMFVYCLNNPVNMFDPSGKYAAYMTEQGRKAVQEEIEAKRKAKEGAEALKRSLDNNRPPDKDSIVLVKQVDTTTEFYNKPLNTLGKGACTWYAFGRALQTGGIFHTAGGDAEDWYHTLLPGYSKGQEIKSRSVAVFANDDVGHVVFVEFVDYNAGYVYYTEGNFAEEEDGILKKVKISYFKNLYGYDLVGYIYTR